MKHSEGDARSGDVLGVPAIPSKVTLTCWSAALSKALLGAAMALAGAGSLLSAGEAQAANNYSCAPTSTGGIVNLAFNAIGVGDTVSCADKKWTINAFDFGGNTGAIDFEWLEDDPSPGYFADQFSTNLSFSPSLIGPGTGFFDYNIQVTQPGWFFDTVQLDSTVGANPATSGDTFVYKEITGGPTLVSENGAPNNPRFVFLTGERASLDIHDSWNVNQGDSLTSIKNTFTQKTDVPGPLPLLGAGAAFAWSRKLRSRVKFAGNQT